MIFLETAIKAITNSINLYLLECHLELNLFSGTNAKSWIRAIVSVNILSHHHERIQGQWPSARSCLLFSLYLIPSSRRIVIAHMHAFFCSSLNYSPGPYRPITEHPIVKNSTNRRKNRFVRGQIYRTVGLRFGYREQKGRYCDE